VKQCIPSGSCTAQADDASIGAFFFFALSSASLLAMASLSYSAAASTLCVSPLQQSMAGHSDACPLWN